jgi:1-acyl-sn-glycerol-3-phosphate acyltransferase
MGLAKHALGEYGVLLRAMAAKDYFFDDPVRRAYFENFTNLVPMERFGSLRESLRVACEVIETGSLLLIFPEGTRSTTGIMTDFKSSLGYLAMTTGCGILPMYLAGTHDALPKGSLLPKQRDIAAHIGPFISHKKLCELTEDCSRSETYRRIAVYTERQVRGLAPDEYEWTLGEAGRQAVADYLADELADELADKTDAAEQHAGGAADAAEEPGRDREIS